MNRQPHFRLFQNLFGRRPLAARRKSASTHLKLERLEDRTCPTSISGLSPASGPTTGGTTVSISGSDFTGATAVYFGTALYGNMDVVNDNLIYVYNPPHAAGVVDVTVVAPGGTSPITSADQFTYTAPPPASTSTYLSLSANPTTFGQALTLTATISHSGYGPAPTGMVEFEDGTTVLATEYLSGAAVTFQTSTLAIGAHSLSAVYLGDTANAGSSSAPQSLTVNAAAVPVVTGLSPNSGPTAGGTYVQIDGSGFTGATGVLFGGTSSATYYVMSDGVIDAYAPAEATGAVDVTVTTAGGTSATSSADLFTYNAAATTTNLSSSVNPATLGQSVTLTATVSNGGAGTPTGTVEFDDGTTVLNTETLAPGMTQASFTTSSLSVGAHAIFAYYGGDAFFAAGLAEPLVLVAAPQINYWIAPAAASASWDVDTNWSLGTHPSAGQALVFDSAHSDTNCLIPTNDVIPKLVSIKFGDWADGLYLGSNLTVAPKPVAKKPTGQKRGARPGHPPLRRQRLHAARVARAVVFAPARCDRCHETLPTPPNPAAGGVRCVCGVASVPRRRL